MRRASLHAEPALQPGALALLRREWPQPTAEQRQRSFDGSRDALPAHLVLVGVGGEEDGAVAAHVLVKEGSEGADGSAAVAFSVVVDSARRGQGLGRAIMRYAEDAAREQGYAYLYLWAQPAVAPFYEACGYERCVPVTVGNAHLEALGRDAVEGLEELFSRLARVANPLATAAAPGDVWLRRRLLDAYPMLPVPRDEVLAVTGDGFHVLDVPWQRQIGGTCGITVLAMAAAYLASASASVADVDVECDADVELDAAAGDAPGTELPGLLPFAIARGLSGEGEMFSSANMARLAAEGLGLRARVLRGFDAALLARLVRAGVPVLVPYDRDASNRPARRGGEQAHWGVIKGVGADGEQFVLAHGVSRRPVVAAAAELLASNAQLVGTQRGRPTESCWVIPEGGPTLAGRVVLLSSS